MNATAYQTAALRTASDRFYPENVGRSELLLLLEEVSLIAGTKRRDLDKIKRSLFYGEAAGIYAPRDGYDVLTVDQKPQVDLLHAILGVITEAGELAAALHEAIEGSTFDEDDNTETLAFDLVNVAEELGDLDWYMALAFFALEQLKTGTNVSHMSFTQDANRKRNIAKLYQRFPDKFEEDRALIRDLEAEGFILAETGA